MISMLRLLLFSVLTATSVRAETLDQLNLEPEATTVSGLSSGAFMAVQLQVAFSRTIAGAGVVAGGPYGCSEENVYRAVRVCMNAYLGSADASSSVQEIAELAEQNRIDPIEHLVDDRIYLFHGQSDNTVARASMDALKLSYAQLGVPNEQIVYETEFDAGHGFVTERGNLECDVTGPDFLIDCDYDQAGEILAHLYPGLTAATEPRDKGLIEFDQSQYLQGAVGMDDVAFVYIPASCAEGALCRLHIALHGCNQGRQSIGDSFARLSGFNRWAEANDIVVLYPQAERIEPPWWNWFGGNPNGCWDWWGFAGSDYLSQDGPQMAAIAHMANALGTQLSR
ncbi:MAG: hypothetical protein AAFZ99_06615 [Pseudomonadota bacterium]